MDENRIIRDAVFEVLGILGTISPGRLEVNPNTRDDAAKIRRSESILRHAVEKRPEVTTTDRIPPVRPKEMEPASLSGVISFGNVSIGYKRISVGDVLESLRNQIEDMTYGGLTEDAEMLALAGILIEKAYMKKPEKDGGSEDGKKNGTETEAGKAGKQDKGKPVCNHRCR